MSLKLNQVTPQVKAMGRSLAKQIPEQGEALHLAQALLRQFSVEFDALYDRIGRAEQVAQTQRFGWVGAAPAGEAIAEHHPLPACPEQLTVIASDGSQIMPDQHAIFPYYLINIGSITYRHGSQRKPDTYNPPPVLNFDPFDEQGQLISPAEINVQRDMAELAVLIDRLQPLDADAQPVVTLLDRQLALRVIDLPFDQQESRQDQYIALLDTLRERGALVAGYVDRPRSTFVLALLQLAALEVATITEEKLRAIPFRGLTDIDLFDTLAPGERSAVFKLTAKGLAKYDYAGHGVHFFYLNVSRSQTPVLARVEIPAWLIADSAAVDLLHAAVVRQARIIGGYPYVLARADELAVISSDERAAVEMMIAVEMRRQGLVPALSAKQQHKNLFRFSRRRF